MSLVRLENVSKAFTGVPVLDGASFRVEEGEKIGLIGRNGTGKSTIFKLIAGDIAPDSGIVERMRRARIAFLAQLPTIDLATPLMDVALTRFSDLIGKEARLRELEDQLAAGDEHRVEEYGHLHDEFELLGGYEFRPRAKRVLTGLGFRENDFELPFGDLSGGQRTRLLLAMALLEDADLL
ncbi:MAG: ATP-binding cassette domain-containing protein, partial [Candidatus Hydrogenedentota bacterium]